MPRRKPFQPLPKAGKCSVCGKSVGTSAMKAHASKHKGKRVTYRAKY